MLKLVLLIICSFSRGFGMVDGDYSIDSMTGPPKSSLLRIKGIRVEAEKITHRLIDGNWVEERECPDVIAFKNETRKMYYRFCQSEIENLLSSTGIRYTYGAFFHVREKLVHRHAFEGITLLQINKVIISQGDTSVVFDLVKSD